MNTQITFEEMAKRGKEILARQGPITYEQAKAQVDKLRRESKCFYSSLGKSTVLTKQRVEFESLRSTRR